MNNIVDVAHLKVRFNFRWEVHQINDSVVEMEVPQSVLGKPILNPEFCSMVCLSEKECTEAEEAVIRAVAIIH